MFFPFTSEIKTLEYWTVAVRISKPMRRMLRFSVRTLFVVFTVFCGCLAIEVNRARRQADLLIPVRQLNASVFYNCNTPIELGHYVGDEFMSHVTAIDFAFTELSDADLSRITPSLGALPDLSWVRLTGSNVTLRAARELKHALPSVRIYNTDPRTENVKPQFTQDIPRSRLPMWWGEKPL